MKIVIIGGGVAGLSAGIYAQLAGFESAVYEKCGVLGGQCTGWDRKGYHIDGCIHWLTGTKEGSGLYRIWQELGVIQGNDIIHLDRFGVYEYEGGAISLWKDLDRLEQELLTLSPEDAGPIKNMIRDIRTMQSMVIPVNHPVDMMPLGEKLRMLRVLMGAGGILTKNSRTSCAAYAQRFKHPALQSFIAQRVPPYFSILAFIFGMANFSGDNGAIPAGGSRGMVDRMEKRYRELGGEAHTGMAAEEIIIRDGRARGVRFAGGGIVNADYVIASCDVHVTLKKLLNNRYTDKRFEYRYRHPREYPVLSSFRAAFGVREDLGDYPHALVFEIEPLTVGVTPFSSLGMRHYAYQRDFAPPGCTTLTVAFNQTAEDYAFWEALYTGDREKYRAEKNRIAGAIQERLEGRFPEFRGKMEFLDAASPATYHRYTGAYQGAWMSFMMTPKTKMMMHRGVVRGLQNFFLSGQWLQPPGGLPIAALYGKYTIQRICKQEKIPWDFAAPRS
ncbi:MAG: NAD(P)/FAD-dependent oxidoreductase [Spirochaetaceae bacterium]|jgi:phytoene dehydrogenase-like protein|nr:NAD(P)/FAD-dependent oxidoreductase [Spirochaetaceae bacterium]